MVRDFVGWSKELEKHGYVINVSSDWLSSYKLEVGDQVLVLSNDKVLTVFFTDKVENDICRVTEPNEWVRTFGFESGDVLEVASDHELELRAFLVEGHLLCIGDFEWFSWDDREEYEENN